MIGAIIGDIAGSRFERINRKSKNFTIFHENSRPTDDSVMSLAVAKAILECNGNYNDLSAKAVSCMQELGRIYKNAGYGGAFIQWIWSKDPKPYGSFGNGAAMRVGPCGFAANSVEEAKKLSAMVTKISHNHPEGMKGAEAIAVSIFLAKSGKSKNEIREYAENNYYDFNFTIDGIRPSYKFDVSCQGSVPIALEAFFESSSFEDAVRNAVSVGGDSDTIAAMTGAVAEAYYGVPEKFILETMDYLDGREAEILYYFEKEFPAKAVAEENSERTIFNVIDDSVDKVIRDGAEMCSGEEPPKPDGYVGTIIFDVDGLIRADGSKVDAPIHVWVKESDMLPDFGSFEQERKVREKKQPYRKQKMDPRKKKTVAWSHSGKKEAVQCFALRNYQLSDTERTIKAIELLKEAGYDGRICVHNGDMLGYVFIKPSELKTASELIQPLNIGINTKPVKREIADRIKRQS